MIAFTNNQAVKSFVNSMFREIERSKDDPRAKLAKKREVLRTLEDIALITNSKKLKDFWMKKHNAVLNEELKLNKQMRLN